jgi:cobaltochelatase CobS
MKTLTKSEIQDIANDTDSPLIKQMANEKLKQEFEGDIVAQKMIQLSQLLTQSDGGDSINEDEVKRIVREQIETDKIKFSDLDDTVKKLLENQNTTVTMTIKSGTQVRVVKVNIDDSYKRPIIQKMLSDVLARNNVYLYGGAGTGKTFSANTIKKILGWNLITVNCNQFTSALELIGGQTIDGYQEGKVIRAFGNLNDDGTPMGKGCVLLLDELPKIDPNTAGILNSVLASVGEYDSEGEPATIENAKGDIIERGDVFILATGNTLLNTKDTEYEANFKQDLSLQDRFAGSTYLVTVDEKYEWEGILKKQWAFIFIYLTKLRKQIQEEGFTAKAFVSIRLMLSVQKTYNVYRQVIDARGSAKNFVTDKNISFTPAPYESGLQTIQSSSVKTIKDTLDEFFSLFNTEQAKKLKESTEYDLWLQIVNTKDKFSLDNLNTEEELKQVEEIIK